MYIKCRPPVLKIRLLVFYLQFSGRIIVKHWLNVEYNTNNYNKNYNIANKFPQNPRQHVYCFDCKTALWLFTFSKGAILPSVKNRAVIKLEMMYYMMVS